MAYDRPVIKNRKDEKNGIHCPTTGQTKWRE